MKPILSYQRGFTLIELMIAVVIMAVLVAIALPSYQQYIIKNAEADAQARMGQLQIELERWRTSTLSYRGFQPAKVTSGNTEFTYDDGDTIIYVPTGSDASNYRYRITLVDGSDGDSSLAAATVLSGSSGASGDAVVRGRSWVMLAEPNPTHSTIKYGRKYLQHSQGLRCSAKKEVELTTTETECSGTGLETW